MYYVDTDEQELMKFLLLNQIDKYNQEMGGVDIADQIRGVYCIDFFVHIGNFWCACYSGL